jgi:terminase small subunit / prophage DNA-packing protein
MAKLKGTGRILPQGELAELLGVTTATLRNWQRAGCPVAEVGGNGRATRYNSAQVFEWRLRLSLAETDLPLEEARRRKLAAEAKLAEMALELKRGELTPTAPMIRYIEEVFGGYKKAIQALPVRYGAQMAAEVGCDVGKLDRALTRVIREYLTELSAPVVRS